MVFRVQACLCLALVLFVFVEGRWHNLKLARRQQQQQQQHQHYHHHHGEPAEDQSGNELSTLLQGDLADQRLDDSGTSDELSVRHRRPNLGVDGDPRKQKEEEEEEAEEEVVEDEAEEEQEEAEQDKEEEEETDESDKVREPVRVTRYRARNHRLGHPNHRRSWEKQPRSGVDPLELLSEYGQELEQEAEGWARGKRHNRRKAWTDRDRKSFIQSRPKPAHFENEKAYEVEVREAQNSSLCNYTVIPIADPGGRMPRDLEHVKCNHVGSRCQDKGTYCCLQTYRNVEVMYENGKSELLKVYSGCVCSLQIYGTLEPYSPELDIDD